MKSEKMKSEVEIFVCNHRRDNDENCYDKGSKDLTDKLKKWAKEDTSKRAKIYRSGCLGKCSEGIAIACYPEKKMLLEASEEDYKEIKKMIQEALN